MTRAILYPRVSSPRQADGYSLPTQEAAMRDYAAAHGYDIVGRYVEIHTAGEHYRSRPVLTEARAAIRRGEADVLLVYDLDRFVRNQAHLYVLVEELETHGARLECVTEAFEQTAVGKVIRSVRAFSAEVEREKISERTTRGKLARVQAGKLLGNGRPLYGYRWRDADRAALDEDPVTSRIVRRVFEAVAEGRSLRAIAAELTDEGIPTPSGRGATWHASALQFMLHNPAYMGAAVAWGLRRRKAGSGPYFDPARGIALPPGVVPAIVDRATWDAVQAILTRNKERSARSARDPEAALLRGGYVRCGYCGSSCAARPLRDGSHEYVCGRAREVAVGCPAPAIRAHLLDGPVWAALRRILTDPAVIAAEVARLDAGDDGAEELAALDRELADCDRKQGNLARALAQLDDANAGAPLVAQLRELGARRADIERERAGVERRLADRDRARAYLGELETWRARVVANVDALTWADRRLLLDLFRFRVTLYRHGEPDRWTLAYDLGAGARHVVTSTT